MLSSTRLDGAIDVPGTGRLTVAGRLLVSGLVDGNLNPSAPAGGRLGAPARPWWGIHSEGSEGLSVNRVSVDALQLRYGSASAGTGYQVRSTGAPIIVSSPSYAVVSGSIARLIPAAGGFSDLASTAGTSVVRVDSEGRLGFFGATPVSRPSLTNDSCADVAGALRTLGLVAP